jgi:hypothetical protein
MFWLDCTGVSAIAWYKRDIEEGSTKTEHTRFKKIEVLLQVCPVGSTSKNAFSQGCQMVLF